MSTERTVENQLWRGAVIPSLIVWVVGLLISTVVRGKSGFIASIFALFIVAIFCAIHLIISYYTKNVSPIAVMILSMASYFAKVIILGTFLLVLMKNTSSAFLDRPSFACVAIAITTAWLGGEIRAFFKLKLTLPLPSNESSKAPSNGPTNKTD